MKGRIELFGLWPVTTVTKINWAEVWEVVLAVAVLVFVGVLALPFLPYLSFVRVFAGLGFAFVLFLLFLARAAFTLPRK